MFCGEDGFAQPLGGFALLGMSGSNQKQNETSSLFASAGTSLQERALAVGTHTGRRTFIVNALSLGIPPNVVMKWTGHNDYKAMKPYIDIVDSIKASEMTKLNGLL